jgi:hypothetical protein
LDESNYGKKTGKPIVGGILLIIASCLYLVAVIWMLYRIFIYSSWDFSYNRWFFVVSFIFLAWGFSIGLAGGIYALKKKISYLH